MKHTEQTQEAMVRAFKLLIDDAKSIQDLIKEPISGKILCYSPDELSDARKAELIKHYNAKMDELKGKPYQTRLERAFFKAFHK